jgi:hypothetical protein
MKRSGRAFPVAMKTNPPVRVFSRWGRRLLVAGVALGAVLDAAAAGHGPLRVTPNHHYLEYADGTPFFYLGDTAWTLFSRAGRADADRYLANRAVEVGLSRTGYTTYLNP